MFHWEARAYRAKAKKMIGTGIYWIKFRLELRPQEFFKVCKTINENELSRSIIGKKKSANEEISLSRNDWRYIAGRVADRV